MFESVNALVLKRLILIVASLLLLAGCGSGGSGAAGGNTATDNGTGGIAARLVWGTSGAKSPAKTLFAAPAGVEFIQINVSAADMATVSVNNIPASAGTATVNGIPAGIGRTVLVRGLDLQGFLLYQGEVTGVPVTAGNVTNVGTITMLPVPAVTSASPPGGAYAAAQSVTLTSAASPSAAPVTIYYTTNGSDPTTASASGISPVSGIQISVSTILKFFSVNALNAQEAVRTETYSLP
jgi:hypothetical protein